jgi:hypothetical protein
VVKMRDVGLGVLAVSALVLVQSPADAKGCGGYVNMAVWGCAPWDNNPPKPGVTPGVPAKPQPQRAPPAAQPASPAAVQLNRSGAGIIGDAGASSQRNGAGVINGTGSGLISNKAGGVLSDNGLGFRQGR